MPGAPHGTATSVLDAPPPARWGWRQRLKNHALYALVRVVFVLLRLTPFCVAVVLATVLGWVASIVARADRRRALENVARALPELSPAEHHRLVTRMFVHLAVSAVELVHADRFLTGPARVVLADGVHALLRDGLARQRGVVLVGGHIGNWELCGQVLAHSGYPITSIAKPVYDPRLTRFVHRLRTAHGARILWRGDPRVAKEILAVFKDNGLLGILIDQDTKVQGAFVPFFGALAHTPTAAASFALRAGAPVIVVWSHRVGGRMKVSAEPCPYVATGDHEADVLALTRALSAQLEKAIRQQPEQ